MGTGEDEVRGKKLAEAVPPRSGDLRTGSFVGTEKKKGNVCRNQGYLEKIY